MTQWDQLPDAAKNGGVLTALEDALKDVVDPTESTDGDWKVFTKVVNAQKVILDGFGGIPGGGTPIEFRDPNLTIALGLHQTAGADDGGWRVVVTSPVVAVHLPFLQPARFDVPNARLLPDPTVDKVSMIVGGLSVRLQQLSGQATSFDFLSASTTGNPADKVYDLVRMEPPYASVGPNATIGIGFRAAVLDLSSEAGPSGLPAGARTMPNAWQGFYLPEVRLFVQPPGLDDLHITAAARDVYLGVGASAGLTAIFEAEVVSTAELTVSAHLLTTAGTYVPVTLADPEHGTAAVPADATLFVDTHGGSGANAVTISPAGAAPVLGTRANVTTGAAGTTVQITVVDAAAGLTKQLTIALTLQAAGGGGAGGAGSVTSLAVTPTSPLSPYRLLVDTLDPAVVRLDPAPPPGATISWSSSTVPILGATTGTSITLDLHTLSPTQPLTSDLVATVSGVANTVRDCHFLFDRPTTADLQDPGWATSALNTREKTAPKPDSFGDSRGFVEVAKELAVTLDHATPLTVDGYASFERADQADSNLALSGRRLDAARRILESVGFTKVNQGATVGQPFGAQPANDHQSPRPDDLPSPAPAKGDGFWWLARVWAPGSDPATVTATLHATQEQWGGDNTTKDVTPQKPPQPKCFRKIGARVEILRDSFIRAELWGEFDLAAAADQSAPGLGRSADDNPADGIVDFLVRLRISEDRQSWEVDAEFKANDNDKDGLYRRDRRGNSDPVIDSVGALAVLAPLTAAVSSLSPAGGAVVALGSVAAGVGGILTTQQLTLFGGQLIVSDGIVSPDGSTGDPGAGQKVSVLFDVETKFAFDLVIIKTAPDKPMSARYKAIGVAAEWGAAASPGFKPLAVFDPSTGYTIDAPDGSLVAKPPLDEILRILGFKVSRDNPLFVEVQFGIGVELGIVKIETATIRAAFDGDGTPDISISQLAATLDVPGVLHGTGYVGISDGVISGGFDVTVTPVGIRISADLAIAKDPAGGPAVGVLFGAGVNFPAPILLGASGLGIYGFFGGMGINFARTYRDVDIPPLDWAVTHLRDDDLFRITAWHFEKDDYSFGAGLVLGTVDQGFTLNLKGALLLSVPGPDITLLALATVLSPGLPDLIGDTTAAITAVIDLDFGRGTVLVALRLDYSIGSLLKVVVPVTAFFDTNRPSHWFIELGSFDHPATVKVLDIFDGSGYIEVHGDGLSLATDPPLAGTGLVFAAGFHIEAVLMGSESVGLYFKAAAGFDALFATDPIFVGGIFEVSGELRLWIVGITASAKLDIIYRAAPEGDDSGDKLRVHGEVRGRVDFFFFSIEGSVELTIGDEITPPDPVAPPLVTGVGLVGRTTQVLLEGSAVGDPVDGVLAKAGETNVAKPGVVPTDMPIDAIPVVSFLQLARTDQANVLGTTLGTYTNASATPWVQIDDLWWLYEVVAVRLTGGPLIPPTSPGPLPSVWWVQKNDVEATSLQLALLDWTPDPHPAAVPYGEALTTTVDTRWGTLCSKPADPAAVLWTFDHQAFGPSVSGWRLTGLAWPDEPGTVRNSPPRTGLRVTEAWRIATSVDALQGTDPAVVVGDAVPCFDGKKQDPRTALSDWAKGQEVGFSARGWLIGAAAFEALDEHAAAGGSLFDFVSAFQASAWEPAAVSAFAAAAAATGARDQVKDAGCLGAILRSPSNDQPEPAPAADERSRKLVEEAWSASGFKPDELADAVVFDGSGVDGSDGFEEVEILLLLPRIGLELGLFVSARAADGSEIASVKVDSADVVSSAVPLPDRWVDPRGPWADPISRAGHLAARVAGSEHLVAALVRLGGLGGKAGRIVTGWKRSTDRPLPAYYVVAVEALLASETRRFDWDVSTLNADQQALVTSLTQPEGSEPLLTPGTDYTVEIDWQATSLPVTAGSSAAPTQTVDFSTLGNDKKTTSTQTFGFRTKEAAVVPADVVTDLSPFVLATVPAKEETGVFTHAGVTVTFSSQRVTALFDAYGLELFAVVHAASGIHPRLADQPDVPTPQVPVSAGSQYATLDARFGVTTPWREAVEQLATDLGCLDESGFDHDVLTLTLPYVFEPLTEYLFDVHARKKGTTDAGDIVYRVPFRSGRFADEADLAFFVGDTRPAGRGVLAPPALAPLVGAVSGSVLDDAFEGSGLGAPVVPRFPKIEVLWSTDAVPQPIAVLVESSEEIVRSRVAPQKVEATSADPDPTHHYWASTPQTWLTVAAATSPPEPDLPDALVDRVVTGPGGTRVVAFVKPGSRGLRLRLELVTAADGTPGSTEKRTALASVGLVSAPWEEDD